MRSEGVHKKVGIPADRKPVQMNDHDNDNLLSPGDQQLLGKINDYFKGFFDIEDVKNDPAYSATDDIVKPYVSQFMKDRYRNSELRNFIRENIKVEDTDDALDHEISMVRKEGSRKHVDDITAEWVREWHERKRKEPESVDREKEVRDFVLGSLKKEDESEVIPDTVVERRASGGIIRLLSLGTVAAAAVFALFLLVKTLIPSGDPEKLFSKYYEPYYAASVVTRSSLHDGDKTLESALESYSNRNYQMAAVQFSEALLTAPSADMPRFYLGVTFIELNDFDRAGILLQSLADRQGEFIKEAHWYLGLLSLKTGNKEKAYECFDYLVRDDGYYSGRAEKILRILK